MNLDKVSVNFDFHRVLDVVIILYTEKEDNDLDEYIITGT